MVTLVSLLRAVSPGIQRAVHTATLAGTAVAAFVQLGRWWRWRRSGRSRHRQLLKNVEGYLALVRQVQSCTGDEAVLTQWKDVVAAPAASIDVSSLQDGEVRGPAKSKQLLLVAVLLGQQSTTPGQIPCMHRRRMRV